MRGNMSVWLMLEKVCDEGTTFRVWWNIVCEKGQL